jgi:hypothetical protein
MVEAAGVEPSTGLSWDAFMNDSYEVRDWFSTVYEYFSVRQEKADLSVFWRQWTSSLCGNVGKIRYQKAWT